MFETAKRLMYSTAVTIDQCWEKIFDLRQMIQMCEYLAQISNTEDIPRIKVAHSSRTCPLHDLDFRGRGISLEHKYWTDYRWNSESWMSKRRMSIRFKVWPISHRNPRNTALWLAIVKICLLMQSIDTAVATMFQTIPKIAIASRNCVYQSKSTSLM